MAWVLSHTAAGPTANRQSSRSAALSSQNINGVYIPSALIIVGIAIVKKEWLPYALVVVSLVGGYKVFSNRMATFFHNRSQKNAQLICYRRTAEGPQA